jgi:hypothetical protein
MDSFRLSRGKLIKVKQYDVITPQEIEKEDGRKVFMSYEIAFSQIINGSLVTIFVEDYTDEEQRNSDYEKIKDIWIE